HRALEVDLDAGTQVAEPGPRQGLLRQIEGELLAFEGRDRKAGARDAHAVASPNVEARRTGDPQREPGALRQGPADGSAGFDEACEHGISGGAGEMEGAPGLRSLTLQAALSTLLCLSG